MGRLCPGSAAGEVDLTPRSRGYDLSRVLALRDLLTDEMVLNHSQEPIRGEALEALLDTVLRLLPDTVSRRTVRNSLTDLVDRRLSLASARLVSWRLAGNLARLRRGVSVGPWTRQPFAEWVPAEIAAVELADRRSKRATTNTPGEPGAWLTFRVLAGLAAGLSLRRFWSSRLAAHHRVLLGFDRRRFRPPRQAKGRVFLPFEDPRQLFRFRLSLLLTPESCPGRVDYHKVRVGASHRDYNRGLARRRARVDFDCPRGYVHACHRCPVGLDGCPVACHARTYVLAPCPACGARQTYVDPSRPEVCLGCRLRGTASPEG